MVKAATSSSITPGNVRITYLPDGYITPGHTAGHASLLVTAGEERVIILGDIFHSAVQIEHPEWINSLDSGDPEQAKITRRQMLQELAQPSTTGVATHVANSVFIKVEAAHSGFRLLAR